LLQKLFKNMTENLLPDELLKIVWKIAGVFTESKRTPSEATTASPGGTQTLPRNVERPSRVPETHPGAPEEAHEWPQKTTQKVSRRDLHFKQQERNQELNCKNIYLIFQFHYV